MKAIAKFLGGGAVPRQIVITQAGDEKIYVVDVQESTGIIFGCGPNDTDMRTWETVFSCGAQTVGRAMGMCETIMEAD